LTKAIKHLRTYRRLFAVLPYFRFVYVSTASKEQEEAAELFALLIQGSGLADLRRYFDLKTKWDNEQYGQISNDELIFLSESRKRYTGEIPRRPSYSLGSTTMQEKNLQDTLSSLIAHRRMS